MVEEMIAEMGLGHKTREMVRENAVPYISHRRCPVECGNCYTNATPNGEVPTRDLLNISLERVREIIDREDNPSNRLLLTGGEWFATPDDLRYVCETVARWEDRDLWISILTSCYWGNDDEALRLLGDLSELPVEIKIQSHYSGFHAERFPYEVWERAVCAIDELGLEAEIEDKSTRNRESFPIGKARHIEHVVPGNYCSMLSILNATSPINPHLPVYLTENGEYHICAFEPFPVGTVDEPWSIVADRIGNSAAIACIFKHRPLSALYIATDDEAAFDAEREKLIAGGFICHTCMRIPKLGVPEWIERDADYLRAGEDE